MLAYFDLASPTLVTCDVSATALGAVLCQLQNGMEKPIAFASRALSPNEQKYSVGEREALACAWACERWHMYLYGRAFTLRTDHQALTALMFTSGTEHRPLQLYRWVDSLQQYDFKLHFTPGRDNVVADLLSRAFIIATPASQLVDMEDDLILLLHTPLQAAVSLRELQQASAEEPLFCILRSYIRGGWPIQVPDELTQFARIKAELLCWNDTCVARGHCTVLLYALRARVLAIAHEGHPGIVRVEQHFQDLVWWPGIDHNVEVMVRDCAACLLSGKTGQPAPPPLQPLT